MPRGGSGVELTRLQVRMIRSMFAQDIAPRPHLSLACKSNPKGVVALAGSNRRQCRRRLRECSVAVIVINACQASRIDQTGVAGQNQVEQPVIIVVSPRDRNALNALQPGVDVSEDRGSPVWSTATAVDPGDVLNS